MDTNNNKQGPMQTNSNVMDADNQEAMHVWQTQGETAFIRHVFSAKNGAEPTATISYAEMRKRFG